MSRARTASAPRASVARPHVAAGLWSLLWALYTTQFIGASFISTGLTGILRSGGVDLAMLGLLWERHLLLDLVVVVTLIGFISALILGRYLGRSRSSDAVAEEGEAG